MLDVSCKTVFILIKLHILWNIPTQFYLNMRFLMFASNRIVKDCQVFLFCESGLSVWEMIILSLVFMQVSCFRSKQVIYTSTNSVACRDLVIPGATAWLYAPDQILVLSSDVWWSLFLDIRYLWVRIWRHIHVCNPRNVCWHNMRIILSTRILLTRCYTMRHCNGHKLSTLQVRRPEQHSTRRGYKTSGTKFAKSLWGGQIFIVCVSMTLSWSFNRSTTFL